MKIFGEFSKDDKETNLSVYCFALRPKEITELIVSLGKRGFTFTFIDADSLGVGAEITGEYKEMNGVRKELEKEGFS